MLSFAKLSFFMSFEWISLVKFLRNVTLDSSLTGQDYARDFDPILDLK